MSVPAAFRLFTEIGIIHQLATRRFESLAPAGLTVAQFSVLDHLLRLPGDWSPARLANAFQVPRPTMTNTLQRLAAAGLVTFETDPRDGRAKFVRPAPAAAATRDAAVAAVAPLLAELPEALVTALLPPLAQLRMQLDAAR